MTNWESWGRRVWYRVRHLAGYHTRIYTMELKTDRHNAITGVVSRYECAVCHQVM